MRVARCTPVPRKALNLVQESCQSQGQPNQNKLMPTTAQTAMTAAARRGGSQMSAQAPKIGNKNQAWILVKSARAQTAPAPAMATSGRRDRTDRSPTRRAKVQNKLKNVSRAARWACAK